MSSYPTLTDDTAVVRPMAGVFLGVYTIYTFVLVLPLILVRRKKEPLKSRSSIFTVTSTLAHYLIILMPTLRLLIGRNTFPCFLYNFIQFFAWPSMGIPLMVQTFRVYHLTKLSVLKDVIHNIAFAETEKAPSSLSITAEVAGSKLAAAATPATESSPSGIDTTKALKALDKQSVIQSFERTKFWTSPTFLTRATLILFLLHVMPVVFVTFYIDEFVLYWYKGCGVSRITIVLESCIFAADMVILLVLGALMLRTVKEQFNIRRELVITVIITAIGVLLFGLAGFLPIYSYFIEWYFPSLYFLLIPVVIDNITTILIPALATFVWEKKNFQGDVAKQKAFNDKMMKRYLYRKNLARKKKLAAAGGADSLSISNSTSMTNLSNMELTELDEKDLSSVAVDDDFTDSDDESTDDMMMPEGSSVSVDSSSSYLNNALAGSGESSTKRKSIRHKRERSNERGDPSQQQTEPTTITLEIPIDNPQHPQQPISALTAVAPTLNTNFMSSPKQTQLSSDSVTILIPALPLQGVTSEPSSASTPLTKKASFTSISSNGSNHALIPQSPNSASSTSLDLNKMNSARKSRSRSLQYDVLAEDVVKLRKKERRATLYESNKGVARMVQKDSKDMLSLNNYENLRFILNHNKALTYLKDYAKSEWSSENIFFLEKLQSYKDLTTVKDWCNMAVKLRDMFLSADALMELNVDSDTKKKTITAVNQVIQEQSSLEEKEKDQLKRKKQSRRKSMRVPSSDEDNKEQDVRQRMMVLFDDMELVVQKNVMDTFTRFLRSRDFQRMRKDLK